MPTESPTQRDYTHEWSSPQEIAKSSWLYQQEPNRILDMIETMNLSRLAFKGQEHGVVTRKTKKRLFLILNRETEQEVDTGKLSPTGQPWSTWSSEGRHKNFKHDWQNNDPFYGYGNNGPTMLLNSIANGEINVSNIDEQEFRADIKNRFKAHYAAQRERVISYLPYIKELQQIATRDQLEAFDTKIKTNGMAPERGMSSKWYIRESSKSPDDIKEEAKKRVAYIVDDYLPYNLSELSTGLSVFGEAPLESNVRDSLQSVDELRGHSAEYGHEYDSNPFIVFRHGEKGKDKIGKALNGKLSGTETSLNTVSWDKQTLANIGSFRALLETIEASPLYKGNNLLNDFPSYRSRLDTCEKTILARQEK